MSKENSSTQSDSRRLGDELNYNIDYEYAKGYAHRVSRIGTRYYQYDENGNLTVEQEWPFNNGETGNGNSSVPTVMDLGDGVYVTDHGWGMVEDTPGNNNGKTPESAYRRDYRWNERNLLAISSDNRYSVLYTYGADGERSGKFSTRSSGGSATETLYFNRMWTWRYDGLLNDRTGQNSKHIYLGETRLVTKIGRADGSFTGEEKIKQYWYHSDHLGSAQLITNVEGEEYERIEYTPYGELWVERASAASNIDIPYRFTGKERDEETGLYYYGARYLDPKTSRWLSTDPALSEYIPGAPINDEAKKRNSELPGMGGVFNTVNLHLYHYAGNNPVKYTDPDGKTDELAARTMEYRQGEDYTNAQTSEYNLARDRGTGEISLLDNSQETTIRAEGSGFGLFVGVIVGEAGGQLDKSWYEVTFTYEDTGESFTVPFTSTALEGEGLKLGAGAYTLSLEGTGVFKGEAITFSMGALIFSTGGFRTDKWEIRTGQLGLSKGLLSFGFSFERSFTDDTLPR